MKAEAQTPDTYVAQLPDDRKDAIQKLRKVILNNLPEGFEETMSYGMLAYVVPHSLYPDGYHCNTKLPLPFMNLASQKNYISVYHSGFYASAKVYEWFVSEYPKHTAQKMDIGKCCIRFKKLDDIPYDLIGQLAGKMTVDEWVKFYETSIKK
jgi:uncharacterized protein YdhG (YjbR/CyaY superfamily)